MASRSLLLAIVSLASVSTATAAAPQDVELVNDASSVSACQRLGEVRGKSAWGGLLASKAYDWALKQMKESASEKGATHLLLLNVSSGYTGSNMLGVAYRCEAPVPTPPPAP